MPVQDVEFDGSQTVDRALDAIHGNEMPRDIERESAPRKPRFIADIDERHGETGRGGGTILLHQLQESFHAPKRTERSHRL